MKRTRTLPPVTLPISSIEPEFQEGFAWFDGFKAPRPTTCRVWRRRDGGVTVRAISRTTDGRRLSYAMKISAG